MKKQALVLSGGGARGAYQVGVVCGLAEIFKKHKIPPTFDFYSGVSAGAINASLLASHADDFSEGCSLLKDLWSGLTSDQIFYTDIVRLGKIGLKFMDMTAKGSEAGKALLETEPLSKLITSNLDFDRIAANIKKGHLKALLITANDYRSSTAITFVQGAKNLSSWNKARRMSLEAVIGTEHIMASSAIPLLFPSVEVDGVYYGDGCVRNSHPCAPSIYLGAERLFVVGVRSSRALGEFDPTPMQKPPSLARVLNVLLNSVLLDGIELDV
ncbi:MAG: patatin-like phospholipase family protein, partial [Bdellovibrionota bacterium]